MSEYEIQEFSRDGSFHWDVIEIRDGKHPRWAGTYSSEGGAKRGIDLLRTKSNSRWVTGPQEPCAECERIKQDRK